MDGTGLFAYDGNGNRIAFGTNTYSWDWANRLTGATVAGTSASYAYLGDGSRASKAIGTGTPVTTAYLWDRQGGLPRLLDDGTTSAVRAGGLTAEIDDAGNDHAWDLPDGLGSVRAQTDDTAAVTGTAEWDAWGNASAGGAGLFGWDGEQADPETGLSFLRARYYSPVFGQFLARDPLGAGNGTRRSPPVGAGIGGPLQLPVPPTPVPGRRADGACPGGESKCDLSPAGSRGTCQFGAACDVFRPTTGWSVTNGDPQNAGCVGWSGNSTRPWGEGLFGFSSMRYYTVCEMIYELKNRGLFWKLIQLAGAAGDIAIGVDAGGWPLNETILALLQILSLPFSLLQMLAGPDTANRLEAAKCSSGNGIVVITVDDRLALDFKKHSYGNDFYYGEYPNPDLYKYGSHYVPQFGPSGGWPCPN